MDEDSVEAAKPASKRKTGSGCSVIVLAPLIGFVVLLVAIGREAWHGLQEWRLLKDGTLAKARVLEIEPTGSSMNDDLKVRIDLDVLPAERAPYRAEVYTYMHPVHFPRYQPGAMVDVRFDPEEPDDVALVPP